MLTNQSMIQITALLALASLGAAIHCDNPSICYTARVAFYKDVGCKDMLQTAYVGEAFDDQLYGHFDNDQPRCMELHGSYILQLAEGIFNLGGDHSAYCSNYYTRAGGKPDCQIEDGEFKKIVINTGSPVNSFRFTASSNSPDNLPCRNHQAGSNCPTPPGNCACRQV